MFTVICISCLAVRSVSQDPKRSKTNLCARCSTIANAKKSSVTRLANKKEKVWIRVCELCGDEQEVKSKIASESRMCKSCSYKNRKKKPKPKRRDSSVHVSKETVEREREKNRKHKERLASEKKSKRVMKQKLSDEQLIKRFLKTNKVTVIKPLKDNQGKEVQIHGQL